MTVPLPQTCALEHYLIGCSVGYTDNRQQYQTIYYMTIEMQALKVPATYYCLSQNEHRKTTGKVGPLYTDIHKHRISRGKFN